VQTGDSWGTGIVRTVLFVTLAFLLSACAARDPFVAHPATVASGDWRLERQVDRVTGVATSTAFTVTRISSNTLVDYPRPAQLNLTCFKEQPIVRFVFDFKVGATRNSVLGYRFDDKPGREVEARFLQDYRVVVIEDRAGVAQFVNDLATSEVLYVRIRSLNTGRSSAEFRLNGAPAAIEAGFAGCPLSAEQRPPRRESTPTQ
jgi:hypothetical protein